MLQAGFKNERSMTKLLAQKFPVLEDDELPLACITRETFAYALTLSVWSVCFKADDDMLKGRAAMYYQKALKDFQGLADGDWANLLQQLLLEYDSVCDIGN